MNTTRKINLRAMKSALKWKLVDFAIASSTAITHLANKAKPSFEDKEFIIATIAFNKPELIKLQLESLKTYFREDFAYLIYDNSSNEMSSKELSLLSNGSNVHYFKPRSKPLGRINPSIDHGIALNHCTKLIAKLVRKPKYVLYLDHDIFLTSSWDIPNISPRGIGLVAPEQKRGENRYYWPGLMLVNTHLVNLNILSFLPEHQLDTGGRLRRILEANKIKTGIIPHGGYTDVANGALIDKLNPSFNELLMSNLIIENYGPWLHLINGSGWRGTSNQSKSLDYIARRIKRLILKNSSQAAHRKDH